jgi:hypothetical protein
MVISIENNTRQMQSSKQFLNQNLCSQSELITQSTKIEAKRLATLKTLHA